MKINWKIRLKNKTWLAGVLALIVSFLYDLLGMLGVTAPVEQGWVMGLIQTVLTMLAMLGVVIDPTTPGAGDSDRAMTYE